MSAASKDRPGGWRGPTVLVCGSREWTDEETMRAWLQKLNEWTTIVHGGARGADEMAGRLGRARVVAYPVDNEIDGPWPGAGPRRNQRMLEESRPDRALAFAVVDSRGEMTRGTADMVRRALRAGVPVTIVPPGSRP